jgi:glycine cleavage system transcriptional repressor
VSKDLLAVTIVGNDRPGIVATVTRSLYEAGCNLNDVTSTILRGHFTMVLIVRALKETSADALAEKLESDTSALDLAVTVRAVDDVDDAIAPPTHVVSVYGADHPGIVFRVTEALATGGANITDLTSRVLGGDDNPVYALMIEVAVPPESSLDPLLDRLRAELEVDITSHLVEADVL